MLSPKRTRYRKAQKGNNRGMAYRGSDVSFGDFAMQAVEPGRVTARQIEAARRAISRHIRRVGRVWIRVFPDVPVSSKPAEVRMGSGKGSPEFWVCRVKPGRIMFELDGVPADTAKTAFELAAAKLPITTRFVQRLGEEATTP
jgi:large subunit ribosomal protein L16